MKIIVLTILIFAASSFSSDSTFVLELRKKMEAGDVDAQIELAKIYNHGKGIVRSDFEEAERLLRTLAEKGNAKAQLQLGRLYHPEYGRIDDFIYNRTRYKCDSIKKEIELRVRRLYFSDSSYAAFVNKNKTKLESEEWIVKEYSRFPLPWTYGYRVGAYISDTIFSHVYDSVSNDMNAESWLLKSANQGLAEAQHSLAWLYETGWGSLQNRQSYDQFYWYEKAAEQDFTPSQSWLGELYSMPVGAIRNMPRAYFWLTIASGKNDKRSVSYLDHVKKEISAQELNEAQKLLDDWYQRHKK